MSSNQKIVKNTLVLYVRMFFIMGVNLYTSRVILQVLGVTDFGIYNLVGGIVVLFAFFNNAMAATTQRYINIEIKGGVLRRINKVFCTSLNIHALIALVVIILAETAGLWFLNNKLNIPQDRMVAANMVYQISIFTTALSIVRLPFDAIILAYEKMSFYAFIGIYENAARLLAVLCLLFFAIHNPLITYAALLLLITLSGNIWYFFYAKRHFKAQTRIRYYRDKALFKELLSFSGWMVFGQLAVVAASQGLSMILNIFVGVVVNAAMGLASQVNSAVYSFVTNFQIAFRPQLTQSYAETDNTRHKDLVLNTSKFSLFLMAVLAVPLLYMTDTLLGIWLGDNVPPYTGDFVRIIILISLIDALAGPFWISAQAIGKIKAYNIILTLINLTTLPIAYGLLKMGYSPGAVLLSKFFISAANQCFRYYFINKYLKFNKKEFLSYLISSGIVLFFLIAATVFGRNNIGESLLKAIFVAAILELALILIVYFLGMSIKERKWIFDLVKNKINNRK